jgi:hypothetical protein
MDFERVVDELRNEREALERSLADLRRLLGAHSSQPVAQKRVSPSGDLYGERLYAERLEEYKFLRVELDKIWEQTYTTMNFMFVAIGIIITAAFSQYGDALILLPCASVLTIGGYRLIRIHTTRVWRIVGYMRCALEKNLTGIRWETRLAERNKVLLKLSEASKNNDVSKYKDLDRDIFDGHVFILDLVNVIIAASLALILALAWINAKLHLSTSPLSNSHILEAIPSFWRKALAVAIAMLFPLTIWARSIQKQGIYKRGQGKETDHLKSWKAEFAPGKHVADAEPPATVREID